MTPRFSVLTSGSYVQYIAPAKSPGWNRTTHTAKIDFGDGKFANCYVKAELPSAPDLACEVVGFVLGAAVGLRQPPRAALLLIDRKDLFEIIPAAKDWAPQLIASDPVVLWCSEDLERPTLRIAFPSASASEAAHDILLQSKGGREIAAFDEWVANADRNEGNLVFFGSGSYAIIDHGKIAECQNWEDPIVAYCSEYTLLAEANKRLKTGRMTPKVHGEIMSGMVLASRAHRRALGDSHPQLLQVLTALTSELQAFNVLSFLSERSLEQWMRSRVGLLI